MLTEKYDFRITDQMTIPLRPHWIANDSYREKCKMLVLNRSKGEIHKVEFSKLTDYIKEGDVICFNDSTIINHMFICKTRQNRLIKIVLEGFLPNNRVIISGLLKERLNANDVFYLVDNPEISIKIEQRFSEESQYRAVVENHEALMLMRIMYIMLNAPEQLKDMLRRLDSCMSKNFWPISLIPSLP